MRVAVLNSDDYREYFQDPAVQQAYINVMANISSIPSDMVDVQTL